LVIIIKNIIITGNFYFARTGNFYFCVTSKPPRPSGPPLLNKRGGSRKLFICEIFYVCEFFISLVCLDGVDDGDKGE